MTIDFFNLLDDDGWVDMPVKQSYSKYLWNDGGRLADAPVDMEATFRGGMSISPHIDRGFNINGLRCRPNFVVPRHHHNMRELIVVLDGEFHVEFGHPGEESSQRVGPGESWISEAGTPYTMTAGPDGVTYLETWREPMDQLETVWHDVGWVRR